MRTILRYLFVALLAVALGLGAWAWTPDRPRAALEAEYAAPPSLFVEIDGARLHVRDTGPRAGTRSGDDPSRTPVLLLHGFGSSLHTWENWASVLERTRRVVRLDLPGFGLTGLDPSGDYSDTRAVVILSALLDRLGLSRVDVIGSSLGGRVAWRFAAERPERVRRLILMAPDGFASDGHRYGEASTLPFSMRLLPYVLPMPFLRQGIAAAYADPTALRSEVLQRYRDMLLAPGVRTAVLDRIGTQILEQPEPFLRRITIPVLLLWGEQDRMVPASHAADYARELPDSRTVVLPGVGHVPMEEHPDRALAAVVEFLDSGR